MTPVSTADRDGSISQGAVDPRPTITWDGGQPLIRGGGCACGYRALACYERCPECYGPMSSTTFGPLATVFASTMVRIRVGDRSAPYGLAYVDLDGGPRMLAHTVGDDALPVRARVVLVGPTDDGDALVALAGEGQGSR